MLQYERKGRQMTSKRNKIDGETTVKLSKGEGRRIKKHEEKQKIIDTNYVITNISNMWNSYFLCR